MNNIYKKGFTLIELIISIALTAIILVFLYQSMHGISKTNNFYKTKLDDFSQTNRLVFLLYNDILLSKNKDANNSTTKLENTNISTFILKTKHSIKGFFNPFVTYVLFKKEKVLYRLESLAKVELPLDEQSIFITRYNKFDNISSFNIHQNLKDFLVYYTRGNRKEFFQISKL
jgi:prepilin-type N-terminal cleavage/methylation domain-containing protein